MTIINVLSVNLLFVLNGLIKLITNLILWILGPWTVSAIFLLIYIFVKKFIKNYTEIIAVKTLNGRISVRRNVRGAILEIFDLLPVSCKDINTYYRSPI